MTRIRFSSSICHLEASGENLILLVIELQDWQAVTMFSELSSRAELLGRI
jgi:hypothetical protein